MGIRVKYNILSRFEVPAVRFRAFRLLWVSGIFNSTGFIGEQVVLGWLVLDMTDSPLMVGLGLALRMTPFLLLGIPAGVIADRMDRLKLLQSLSIAMSVLSGCLFLSVLAGMITVSQLLVLTFFSGCLRALYQPARQSFAYDIVGENGLVNGISLLSLSMRLGGVVGSLGAGLLIGGLGAGAAYGFLTASYLFSFVILRFVDSPSRPTGGIRKSMADDLRELRSEAQGNATFRVMIILSAAVEVLGFSHQAILPILARDVLEVGPEGLGILNALRSVGGIGAVIGLSLVGPVRRKGLIYLVALHVFGVSLILLGMADTFVLATLGIIVINAMGALSDILSQSLVQIVVPTEVRGRAMGTWVLAIGLGPVGHLQIGALVSLVGVGVALSVHGVGLLVLAVGALFMFPKVRAL